MRTTVILAAIGLSTPLLAQTQSAPQNSANNPARPPETPQPVLPDTPGTGRYPAIKQVDATLPDHVVYRPANLSQLGQAKLGVVVWGNGGCSDDGASARQHLAELASHGYLVIAPGKVLSGPATPPPPPRPAGPPAPLGVKTSTADVKAGLDWALAENARKGSPYFGRIDPRQLAVAGHSCGGLQAIELAADPRIRAVIVHNSGIFADGSNPIPGITVNKSMLTKLHTPIIYILGGPSDIAYPNGTDDFAKITSVPAVLLNLPVGHGGTFREPNGGRVAQVAVKWLAWQLRGDAAAGASFTGATCGLCTNKDWTIERKKIG